MGRTDTVLRKLTDWCRGSTVPQEPLKSKRECLCACTRLGAEGAQEVCLEEEDPSRAWKEGQGGLSFLPKAAWLEGHTLWLSSEAGVLGKSGTRERLPEAIGSRGFFWLGSHSTHHSRTSGSDMDGQVRRQNAGAEGPRQGDQGSRLAEGAGERVQERCLGWFHPFLGCGTVQPLPPSSESESRSVVSDSLQPYGLYSPWNSPGQNTGVGGLSLLQGIFQPRDPTQVSHITGGFFTS